MSSTQDMFPTLLGHAKRHGNSIPQFSKKKIWHMHGNFVHISPVFSFQLKNSKRFVLKNLKDFLLYTINSREQSTHLEELSPCLAHFNRRAIEIPGQHVLSEAEPLP